LQQFVPYPTAHNIILWRIDSNEPRSRVIESYVYKVKIFSTCPNGAGSKCFRRWAKELKYI
jgi:hypothetical protein